MALPLPPSPCGQWPALRTRRWSIACCGKLKLLPCGPVRGRGCVASIFTLLELYQLGDPLLLEDPHVGSTKAIVESPCVRSAKIGENTGWGSGQRSAYPPGIRTPWTHRSHRWGSGLSHALCRQVGAALSPISAAPCLAVLS